MARAHLYRPITDEDGNLLYGAVVTVRSADASGLLGQSLYGTATATDPITNPVILSDGILDVWIDTPARVSLLVQDSGRDDLSIQVDVMPSASEVVRSTGPLTISTAPVNGKVLMGVSTTEAQWSDPATTPSGGVPVHYHEGTGANSVALGANSAGSGSQATAVGDTASASADQSTAFGYSSAASAQGASALGSNSAASAVGASAVGYQASASGIGASAIGSNALATADGATALGSSAQANGTNATALGYQALASGARSVAVGSQAIANAPDSVALGVGSSVAAAHTQSVAIGSGAQTTDVNQVALGGAAHTVLALGGFRALGSAVVGSVGSNLGFFGAAPAARQTLTGDDGGDPMVRSLLAQLGAIGLIDNQTTQGTALGPNANLPTVLALVFEG